MSAPGHPQPLLDTAVICHDQPLVAAALAAVLERHGVVRCARTVPSLPRLLSSLQPSVQVAVVFDEPGDDVGELLEALWHRGLSTPILIMSDQATPERAARALDLGAAGLLPSSCSSRVLCRAVLDARRGNAALDEEMRGAVLESLHARRLQRYAAERRLAELSSTERRVLTGLADGTSVTRMAGALALSPHTVRSHVRALGLKLGTRGQLRIAATGRTLLAAAHRSAWDSGPAAGEEGA